MTCRAVFFGPLWAPLRWRVEAAAIAPQKPLLGLQSPARQRGRSWSPAAPLRLLAPELGCGDGGRTAQRGCTDAARAAGPCSGPAGTPAGAGIRGRHMGCRMQSVSTLPPRAGQALRPVLGRGGIPPAVAADALGHGPMDAAAGRRASVLGSDPRTFRLTLPAGAGPVNSHSRACRGPRRAPARHSQPGLPRGRIDRARGSGAGQFCRGAAPGQDEQEAGRAPPAVGAPARGPPSFRPAASPFHAHSLRRGRTPPGARTAIAVRGAMRPPGHATGTGGYGADAGLEGGCGRGRSAHGMARGCSRPLKGAPAPGRRHAGRPRPGIAYLCCTGRFAATPCLYGPGGRCAKTGTGGEPPGGAGDCFRRLPGGAAASTAGAAPLVRLASSGPGAPHIAAMSAPPRATGRAHAIIRPCDRPADQGGRPADRPAWRLDPRAGGGAGTRMDCVTACAAGLSIAGGRCGVGAASRMPGAAALAGLPIAGPAHGGATAPLGAGRPMAGIRPRKVYSAGPSCCQAAMRHGSAISEGIPA